MLNSYSNSKQNKSVLSSHLVPETQQSEQSSHYSTTPNQSVQNYSLSQPNYSQQQSTQQQQVSQSPLYSQPSQQYNQQPQQYSQRQQLVPSFTSHNMFTNYNQPPVQTQQRNFFTMNSSSTPAAPVPQNYTSQFNNSNNQPVGGYPGGVFGNP